MGDVASLLERGGRDHTISPASFLVQSAATGWDLLAMWRTGGGLGESYAIGPDPTAPLAVLADDPWGGLAGPRSAGTP